MTYNLKTRIADSWAFLSPDVTYVELLNEDINQIKMKVMHVNLNKKKMEAKHGEILK